MLIILSYTVSKFTRFFETQSRDHDSEPRNQENNVLLT